MKNVVIGLLWMGMSAAAAAGGLVLPAAVEAVPVGQWLQYEVPLVDGVGSPCCIEWRSGQTQPACSLESENWNMSREQAPDSALRVFLRRSSAGIDRVRAYGSSCAVEVGTSPPVAVALEPGSSIGMLADLAAGDSTKRVRSAAVAALALHAEPAASARLDQLARGTESKSVRHDAIFWLTQARGRDGYERVRQWYAADPPQADRRHAIFALSQSPVPERGTELARIARADADPELRGEALFWLAQALPEAAEPVLEAALADPSGKVREKAVFAISQLPAERAVPRLSALARDTTASRELRKQALFWLSQADPERAMPEIDRLLGEGR